MAAQIEKSGRAFAYEAVDLPYTYSYVPDFYMGGKVVYEAKGVLDQDTIRKMRAVKAQHPDWDIRLIFQRPTNRISGTKMTYADWAERNGFPWCGPNIPKHWLR